MPFLLETVDAPSSSALAGWIQANKPAIANVCYMVAAALFIFGLKGLTHPRTAVRGNLRGATGMLIAIVAVLWATDIVDWRIIVGALAIGSLVGYVAAVKVPMTGMPQMVALLNGFGGIASVFVAGAELERATVAGIFTGQTAVATGATGLIGAVTFTGSVIAALKLQEWMSGNPILFGGQKLLNALLFGASLVLGAALVADPVALASTLGFELTPAWAYWALVAAAAVLGVGLTIPIGGADMPVVIALLNSYSGLAAAATGFVISNNVLIIAGSLVGASGIILTRIMCKAMNRSLANVLFGVMGEGGKVASADEIYAGKVKSTSADEIAMLFDTAQRVIVVPGYGMAVSQAQHAVRDLGNLLMQRGIKVEYAIHPVAGRMPGHMNVLLAEADVPYDLLKEMDAINPEMEQIDVAIVVGANDVVNPLARTDPQSPIAGMPIINVDQARTVIVVKRSLSPGFAGIPNPLFALPNTLMFFSDGKKAFQDIIAAIKEAG